MTLAAVLVGAVVLMSGCSSHAALTYDGAGGGFAVTTLTRATNVAVVEAYGGELPESFAGGPVSGPDGDYYEFSERLDTGEIDSLIISQNGFDEADLPYDGRRMVAGGELTVYSMDGQPIGALGAGEEIIARHMVGSAVAVIFGDGVGYVSAAGLTLSEGGEVEYVPLQNQPVLGNVSGGECLITLGCQTTYSISGDRIARIVLGEDITAGGLIEVDFDELVIEGGAPVRIAAGVVGGKVYVNGASELIIDEGAAVDTVARRMEG